MLRAGAVAELVALDRDPFDGSADTIGSTRVLSAWVDGTAVYRA